MRYFLYEVTLESGTVVYEVGHSWSDIQQPQKPFDRFLTKEEAEASIRLRKTYSEEVVKSIELNHKP